MLVIWTLLPYELIQNRKLAINSRDNWYNCVKTIACWNFIDCFTKDTLITMINVIRTLESSYILQPPKYLLLFVIPFRYINNNVTKDRCAIPMDTTIRLGPLKFSLRATIDHHGPSIHSDSGHYTASINCCKKTFYCNDHTVKEFGITDNKNSSTAYQSINQIQFCYRSGWASPERAVPEAQPCSEERSR